VPLDLASEDNWSGIATIPGFGSTLCCSFALRYDSGDDWLELSRTGRITGTPGQAGTFQITFRVTDSSRPRMKATQRLQLVIRPAARHRRHRFTSPGPGQRLGGKGQGGDSGRAE
jgi:Putative Ig domain